MSRTEAIAITFGVRSSRATSPTDSGHAWIEYDEKKREHRGYYPILSTHLRLLFDELRHSEHFIRDFWMFFLKNDVPGAVTRDKLAELEAKRSPKGTLAYGTFQFASSPFATLLLKCHIPDKRDYLEHGRYGLQVDRPGINNCVTWAARTVNGSLGREELPSSSPSVREMKTWIEARSA